MHALELACVEEGWSCLEMDISLKVKAGNGGQEMWVKQVEEECMTVGMYREDVPYQSK